MRWRGTLVAIGALAVVALAGGQAQAVVSCGKTVTKDIKLKEDLIACPGDGLVVGANDITIDLNGHKIDGQSLAGQDGIAISGHSGVVVKGSGGKIKQFEYGVKLLSAQNNRVSGLKVDDVTLSGVYVNTSSSSKIKGNTITEANFTGVEVTHSDEVEVSGNSVTGPDTTPLGSYGIGVNAPDSEDNVVEDNVVKGGVEGDWGIVINGTAQATLVKRNTARGFVQQGIYVYDGAADTKVRKNEAIGNGSNGIRVDAGAGTGTAVLKNTARKNFDGISVAKAGVGVGDNVANDNGNWGIIATAAINDLGGNKASGNGQAAQCSGIACS
jgi:parallel beta-helix repeat protein